MPVAGPRKKLPQHPDETRMTLGEHLDELRSCLIRCLVALGLACLPCFWLAPQLLAIIARPLLLANRRFHQPDTFLTTHPAETFLIYLKVVLIAGLVLAAPYILYQLWMFVAAGLYPRERAWVYRLVPFSVALFLLGVAFMYAFVLLLSLNFLVGFSSWLKMPEAYPTALERVLLGEQDGLAAATQPAGGAVREVPLLAPDPDDPPVGAVWFNAQDRRLKLRGPDGTYSLQLQPDRGRPMVTAHFRIGEYLSFVLILTIAFGVAFQTPLVVLFLSASGIVPLETLRRYRKGVIVVIVVIAGAIAPPDIFSHIMLSLPMYGLFELGMLLARRRQQSQPA
jgi:sec-independent protein translocase protein TatC